MKCAYILCISLAIFSLVQESKAQGIGDILKHGAALTKGCIRYLGKTLFDGQVSIPGFIRLFTEKREEIMGKLMEMASTDNPCRELAQRIVKRAKDMTEGLSSN